MDSLELQHPFLFPTECNSKTFKRVEVTGSGHISKKYNLQ